MCGPASRLAVLVSGLERKESGVDSLHAEAADHLECDGEEPDAVASRDGTRLCRGT